ncbi:hypothetical protein [Rhizomonospora bruguierae]|uniref:hypothetical protein n=1 Tax=Rhizomonospora bruguierae TaxID=1581705 RepID=UPI001BCDD678|nr:hypothetical protein [Micromonospora sp. NBRC 107566]
MTTFVLVHGAWHGPWTWDRVVPLLHAAGMRTLTPGDRIAGTAVYCRPQTYPFDRFGEAVGYQTLALDGPHDVLLTHPKSLARLLLEARPFKNGKHEA